MSPGVTGDVMHLNNMKAVFVCADTNTYFPLIEGVSLDAVLVPKLFGRI
jgi:hypothetical protein